MHLMNEMIMAERISENGNKYYYLVERITYFYDPHGTPDWGGAEKSLQISNYDLGDIGYSYIDYDHWEEEFYIDDIILAKLFNDTHILDNAIEAGIDINSEELDEILPSISDDDYYAQDGYNFAVDKINFRKISLEEYLIFRDIIANYENLKV